MSKKNDSQKNSKTASKSNGKKADAKPSVPLMTKEEQKAAAKAEYKALVAEEKAKAKTGKQTPVEEPKAKTGKQKAVKKAAEPKYSEDIKKAIFKAVEMGRAVNAGWVELSADARKAGYQGTTPSLKKFIRNMNDGNLPPKPEKVEEPKAKKAKAEKK